MTPTGLQLPRRPRRQLRCWGRGLATEAARAVLAYGFEDLGLQRIFATADARNLASLRVMQRLGMQQEAYLRRHRFYRGEHADEVWYAILAEEYPGPSAL